MVTVGLTDLRIVAKHGVYEEETLCSNIFNITVSVSFPFQLDDSEDLDKSFDYNILHTIVVEEMAKTSKLLETIAYRIFHRVKHSSDKITSFYLKIEKQNPPLGGSCKNSFVEVKL